MVEKYLRPINMEHLAKEFTENRINGAVLMALEVRAGYRATLSFSKEGDVVGSIPHIATLLCYTAFRCGCAVVFL